MPISTAGSVRRQHGSRMRNGFTAPPPIGGDGAFGRRDRLRLRCDADDERAQHRDPAGAEHPRGRLSAPRSSSAGHAGARGPRARARRGTRRGPSNVGHVDLGQRCTDRGGVDGGLEATESLRGEVVELCNLGTEVGRQIEVQNVRSDGRWWFPVLRRCSTRRSCCPPCWRRRCYSRRSPARRSRRRGW